MPPFDARARRDHPHCGGNDEQFRIPQFARKLLLFDRLRFHHASPPRAQEKKFHATKVMSRALADFGSVALYGISFDADSEVEWPEAQPTLEEVAKLLKNDPRLKVQVVSHTDGLGSVKQSLALRRRAESLVRELTTKRHRGWPARVIWMRLLRARGAQRHA
jgi:hypothetical protein